MEHFLQWTLRVPKAHIVDGEPIIGAKIVKKDVDAAAFLRARANTNLEYGDHA